jgi:hypothetical protein
MRGFVLALSACAFIGCTSQIPDSYDPDDGDDVATDDDGGKADGSSNAPIMPAGTVLWTSVAWANGHARSLTAHGAFDPDDPKLQLSAGEDRRWSTAGNGTSKLEGNRSRLYLHAAHRNIEMVFEANATDTRLENISIKLRSRHNAGGSNANRFGGYGVAFNLKEQNADFKIESYHNVHESGREKTLQRHLSYNHWYRYKVTIQAKDGEAKAVVKAYIDYDLNDTWTWIGTQEYARTGYRKNDMNAKYTWIRANAGDDTQTGLLLRNVKITEIAPL